MGLYNVALDLGSYMSSKTTLYSLEPLFRKTFMGNIVVRLGKYIVVARYAEEVSLIEARLKAIVGREQHIKVQSVRAQGEVKLKIAPIVQSFIADRKEILDYVEAGGALDSSIKSTDEETRKAECEQIIKELAPYLQPGCKYKVSKYKTGHSYRVNYFDTNLEKRRQINLGDVVIMQGDDLFLTEEHLRKARSDAADVAAEMIAGTLMLRRVE